MRAKSGKARTTTVVVRTFRFASVGTRLIMKRFMLSAALVALAAAPLFAGGGAISGSYVEARTAEVFTGGCIMGSEAETMGKEAVLAWKVDRGTVNGVSSTT